MKYLKLAFFSFIITSCNFNEIPECNDEKVKNETILKFKENLKPLLIDEYIKDEINYEDLRTYAWDKGLNYNDVLEEEKSRLKFKFDSVINFNLSLTKLKNVRTEKIEKEIKKCTCNADVDNTFLKPISIFYTAQKTEDNDNFYVEINDKMK